MAFRVDTKVAEDLKRYGGDTFSKCFNCGNCTAVCALTDEDNIFPRRFIRYAQLGMTEKMMESPEPWMCYYCGECSETCPREAEPGELMAAARRWLVSNYEVTGLAKVFFTSFPLSIVFLVVIAVILGVILMSGGGTMARSEIVLWDYVDNHVAHNTGLVLMAIVFLAGLAGVVRMFIHTSRSYRPGVGAISKKIENQASGMAWIPAAFKTVFVEVLGHSRYVKCDEDKEQPWYLKRWFVHGATIWGFLGTGFATLMHWIFLSANLKDTGEWIPAVSIPIRIWGIIAGLFLVYGTSVLLANRLFVKSDKQAQNSVPADWIFLVLLWFSGITGFLVLIGHYAQPPQMWVYPILLIHAVISMELFVLLPFTKFAHVFYRTVAIFIMELRKRSHG